MTDLFENWCLVRYFLKKPELFDTDEKKEEVSKQEYGDKLCIHAVNLVDKSIGRYLFKIIKETENTSLLKNKFQGRHLPIITTVTFPCFQLFTGCSGKTKIICCSCKVPLCFNTKRNCFYDFHHCR